MPSILEMKDRRDVEGIYIFSNEESRDAVES